MTKGQELVRDFLAAPELSADELEIKIDEAIDEAVERNRVKNKDAGVLVPRAVYDNYKKQQEEALRKAIQFIADDTCRHDYEKARVLITLCETLHK